MRSTTLVKAIAPIIVVLLLSLAAATSKAIYSIEPEVKGWAVKNPMNESYTFAIVHDGSTDNPVVATAKTFIYTDDFIDNETFFEQIPKDLMSYVTITPKTITIDKGETGYFTVSLSFPDLPKIYNKTYEVHILVNDTNPYNSGTETQQIHVVRLFMPDGPPPTPPEPTPLYVYIGAGVVFLIFAIVVIQLLRKRTLSVARQDTPLSHNEWVPLTLEKGAEKDNEKREDTPVIDATANPTPQPPVRINRIIKEGGTVVPYKRKVKS